MFWSRYQLHRRNIFMCLLDIWLEENPPSVYVLSIIQNWALNDITWCHNMITLNWNISRVTDPLWWESISHQYSPQKGQWRGAFSKRWNKQSKRRWYETPITETKISSFWRNFNHWLLWKLSFWQLPVQPVIKISSKWRHFRFSDCEVTIMNSLAPNVH